MKARTILCLFAPPLLPIFMFTQNLLQQNASKSEFNPASNVFSSVQEAWVSRYASGLINDDTATDIVVDPKSGEVYVTGYSLNLRVGYDYFTVKYNSAGAQVWTARFNGSGNGGDLASAITRDAFGNIYVTGKSWSGTSYDYVTIKYNAAGMEQWVARYNHSGNSDDAASALAVDGFSNVYVTGKSANDFATIKYNRDGVEQWAARYNGPGNLDDGARAIAVNNAGEVYVTGSSQGADTFNFYDYATIKYNAAGAVQWVARYDGLKNGNDHAHALAIDHSGNVYVTGGSEGYGFYNYATIKYSSAGIQQWVARSGGEFDYAFAIAVDAIGNAFVTGWTQMNNARRYLTIKYKSTGEEEWGAIHYKSLGEARDIAVDNAGNVYVTGKGWGSYATVKYSSFGSELWAARYTNGPENYYSEASAIAVDSSGNVYVTGFSQGAGTSYDYATLKYDSAGMEKWAARYDGPGNSNEHALALAVDDASNVYVTGRSLSGGPYFSYATVKYNSAGFQQWVSRHIGAVPGYPGDETQPLAVDRSGNVYVTGSQIWEHHYWFSEYVTVKYDPTGTQQWSGRYKGVTDSENNATAIAVDDANNVYVTGASYGSGYDYATIKYDAMGVRQWVARYNGRENDYDKPTAIALGPPNNAENVYVTGWTGGFAENKRDYGTVKYNVSGIQQWIARYNGPENSNDEATSIVADKFGNVYVTGYSRGAGTSWDYATVKYNSSGVQDWVARYNGPGNSEDRAYALALDRAGNVYVTGASVGSGTSWDYATVKYDGVGALQWVARYNGSEENAEDQAIALAVDESESVYVTGWSLGSDSTFDYATIKYDGAGVEQWVARYKSPENDDDKAKALVLDGAGNIYVTGSSSGKSWSIYTTIKYVQAPVSVKEKEPILPSAYWLGQNYPNPFNPATTISYALARPGRVTLKVFDLAGKEIATLVNETKTAGEHEIQWNPSNVSSGVYVYRLQAGEFAETKKLILLK